MAVASKAKKHHDALCIGTEQPLQHQRLGGRQAAQTALLCQQQRRHIAVPAMLLAPPTLRSGESSCAGCSASSRMSVVQWPGLTM